MRALCTGDLHFGAGTRYADDRLGEQEQAWSATLDIAEERGLPVIVAGDIWHLPRPTPAQYLAFSRPISQHPSVDVFACAGNHDWLAANQPTGLEVLDTRGLYTTTLPIVTNMSWGKIGWLPWTPPTRVVAANPGLDRDQVNAIIASMLIAAAHQLVDEGAELLVAHWSVSEALLPSGERAASIMREPMLPLSELLALEVPVVLGHIHRPQMLGSLATSDVGQPVFYVGSPIPLDFGEGDYEHGIWLLDTEAIDEDMATFLPLESRQFLTVDHRDQPEAADAIAFALSTDARMELPHNAGEGCVLRFRYRATQEQQAKIDTAELSRRLMRAGASRVYILPEVVKSVRARVEAVSEDLGPAEALGAWLRATDSGPEQAMALLALTDQLLKEAA